MSDDNRTKHCEKCLRIARVSPKLQKSCMFSRLNPFKRIKFIKIPQSEMAMDHSLWSLLKKCSL